MIYIILDQILLSETIGIPFLKSKRKINQTVIRLFTGECCGFFAFRCSLVFTFLFGLLFSWFLSMLSVLPIKFQRNFRFGSASFSFGSASSWIHRNPQLMPLKRNPPRIFCHQFSLQFFYLLCARVLFNDDFSIFSNCTIPRQVFQNFRVKVIFFID